MYKILAKTLFLAKRVISMPTCHSSNDTAQLLAQKPDTAEGTVIICEEQSKGKGQRGNTWESTAGKNLTLSVILQPKFLKIKDQFSLNMVSSLAVGATVSHYVPAATVKVKWPNDVLVNDKKIAGILIENSLAGQSIESAIVGIGLNVNQASFQAPRATSLRLQAGVDLELNQVFETLMCQLEKYYLMLKGGRQAEVKTEYLTHLYGYQETRKFLTEYRFEGRIEDVTDSGLLVVRGPHGRQQYDLKEITFLY